MLFVYELAPNPALLLHSFEAVSVQFLHVDHFDRNRAVQVLVIPLPDHAIGTMTNGMFEAVVSDDDAWFDLNFHVLGYPSLQ